MAHGIQLWLASTRITHAGRGRIMMAASERAAMQEAGAQPPVLAERAMRICW